MLTKLYLTNKEIAAYPIREITDYNGFVIMDCFNNVYRDHKNSIPQSFNNQQVFISSQSFSQNHIHLGYRIRKFVSTILGTQNIIAIGGESYLYGLTQCENIIHYTNSKFIYFDCHFNNKFYRKNIENNLINYNKDSISNKNQCCLINLSSLPINLMNQVNSNQYFKLVIISCNHDDFWKKRKILKNYRLLKREKFICEKIGYFITVNIFVPNFISLGGNCAVSYQMRIRGIRMSAYPFDWSRIKYSKLVRVLENNFEDYDRIRVDKFSENHDFSYLLKNKYNTFAHEIRDLDKLDDFSKKIVRRVERFKKINGCVFIRIELDNVIDYSSLLKQLDKYFLEYKLIVISRMKTDSEKIIHYKLPDHIDWKYNNFDWDQIFCNVYLGK